MNRDIRRYANSAGITGYYRIINDCLDAVPDVVIPHFKTEIHLPDPDGFTYPIGNTILTFVPTFGNTKSGASTGFSIDILASNKLALPPNQQTFSAVTRCRGLHYQVDWGRDEQLIKIVIPAALIAAYCGSMAVPDRAVVAMIKSEIPDIRPLTFLDPVISKLSVQEILLTSQIAQWSTSFDPLDTGWIERDFSMPKHPCICEFYLLMREGCKCGGV